MTLAMRFCRAGGRLVAVATAVLASGCASTGAPPAAVTPAAPVVVTLEQKAAWILRLEQQRVLVDPAGGGDLIALVSDDDPGVRRRAALALGRVGMPAGVEPLIAALKDPEEPVRAAGAFALGLTADARAVAPLEAALADSSAVVRGQAALALGLIGDVAAAGAVADAAAVCPSVMRELDPDNEEVGRTPVLDACRMSLLALVRLGRYEDLARVVLDAQGRPVSSWWPVAFALQRVRDRRAADALAALSSGPGVYSPAFAIRGLAELGDPRGYEPALGAATRADADVRLRATAIRALGQLGDARAVQPLLSIMAARTTPPNLVLEAVTALGTIGSPAANNAMLDLFAAPWPALRSAARNAAARMDPDGFLLALSSTPPDPDWSVRAALAGTLTALPAERAMPALSELAADRDVRVQAPALRALAQIGAADLDRRLFDALQAPDFGLRATAAGLVGERKPAGGLTRLAGAYKRGESDATPAARTAALEAAASYGGPEAAALIKTALADREWPVRLRAAELLHGLGDATAAPERPAPLGVDATVFDSARLLRPTYSPQAYVETPAGTIQIELDVIDAPLTTLRFVDLARSGFFDGLKVHRLIPNFVIQAGDPRGDGEGGPGYTIRDEFSSRPFVRGTVGMALGGPETGGSQFFIALSPQPHLDGRYTVFGRVVQGFGVLDRVALGDVITRVTIQDGTGR